MKRLLLLGIFVGVLTVSRPAQAGGFFSFHIGIPPVSVHIGSAPPPVRVHCAPIVAVPPPCAPPVVVIAPPRIVLRPPAVVVPAPVVIYPRHRHRVVRGPFCP